MTTINTIEDLARILQEQPTWAEALRALLLTQDLLDMPARFDRFVEIQQETNRLTDRRFSAFVNQQENWNENATIRFNRIEADMSSLKGEYARTRTIQDARGIAADLGLEYLRTLSNDDLNGMAGSNLDRDLLRSFRNADLVIEATDGTDTRFITMEISFTADQRDCRRAIRNAELITQFTGKPAQAAIASVRNDQAAATAVESGAVYWHPLENRTADPE